MSEQTSQQHTPVPDKLTCKQVTDLLLDYVTAEMVPAMRVVFEAHLQNCADCVAFLNTYRETMRATRTVRAEDVPEELFNRVRQFIHTKLQGPQPR
jgi:predicted anti-sigma-YlaC factor YlaD